MSDLYEYEINGSNYSLIFHKERREKYKDLKYPDFDPFKHTKLTRIELVEYIGKRSYDKIGTFRLNEASDGLTFTMDGKKVTQIR